MQSQPFLGLLLWALIPTVLFIGSTIVFVRRHSIVRGFYRRWGKEARQPFVDKK